MLVIVQKKVCHFFQPLFFCANQRMWINKVLTHACVNVLYKKNHKLAPFLIYIKKEKKHAPINHLMLKKCAICAIYIHICFSKERVLKRYNMYKFSYFTFF